MLSEPKIMLTGLVIGFVMSAPIGPVNILVIQRAIQHGLRGGMIAGFGAVLGDGLIACVAAFGITAVTAAITAHDSAIRLIGGFVLLLFGWRMLRMPPATAGGGSVTADERGLLWLVPQTLALTLTNPGAVLGMLALYGSTGAALGINGPGEAAAFVACVMTGAMTWWVVLSLLVGRLQSRLVAGSVARINTVAGVLMTAFGALIIADLLLRLAGRGS